MATLPEDHEAQRFEMARREHKLDYSFLNAHVMKFAIPLFLAVIAAVQVINSFVDAKEKNALAEAVNVREDARTSREWAQFAFTNAAALTDADPAIRCRAVELLRVATPATAKRPSADIFSNYVQVLNIDVGLCANKVERDRAIAQYRMDGWEPYRVGASKEEDYIRRDPATGELYSYTCSVPTSKIGDTSGSCALPEQIANARIYRYEFSCTDYKCGWSYRSSADRTYAINADQQGERAILWRRYWEGDPHLETYTLYYEKKTPSGPPPRKNS